MRGGVMRVRIGWGMGNVWQILVLASSSSEECGCVLTILMPAQILIIEIGSKVMVKSSLASSNYKLSLLV